MRGLENLVGAVIVLGLVVSLTAAASLLITRLVYTGIHVLNSAAVSAMPPRTELVPLANGCSNSVLPIEVRVTGYSGNFSVVLYDLSGKVIGAYRGFNGSALVGLPCDRDVVIMMNTSNGVFWVYRYELDPKRYCLAGYIVNASAVLRKCSDYVGPGVNASSLSMLQPVWIRSILVENDNVLQLLKRYGPVPGLVINESETSYTLIGDSANYSVRYVPIPYASAFAGYNLYLDYPVYCKPIIGCYYISKTVRTSVPERYSTVTMHIEYEDATLLIGRPTPSIDQHLGSTSTLNGIGVPGWIYLRDYRVVFPLTANLLTDSDAYYGIGWTYKWKITANLTPPFFIARIYTSQSRDWYNTSWTCITTKSISPIYSRPIDILLVPLLVSRHTQPFTISFGLIPVNYTSAGRLYWTFMPSYTFKSYGPAYTSPQYIALYAYLVPLSEWRPGIPVDDNLARLMGLESRLIIRALYGEALVNPTRISNTAFGATVTINPREFFEKSGLMSDNAILVLELVITTNGRTILVDTINNTDDIGQTIFCHGVALVSGINDYIHLSILPAIAQTSYPLWGNYNWLVLMPGESITDYQESIYQVARMAFPKVFNKELEFRTAKYVSGGYNVQVFWANTSMISTHLLAIPVTNTQYVVQETSTTMTPREDISLSINSFVSAETIWEKVLQKGIEALVVR